VEDCVYVAVAAAAQAVALRLAVAFGRGGRERRRAVEACKRALAGEAAWVAGLDEQFGCRAGGEAAQLVKGRPGALSLRADGTVVGPLGPPVGGWRSLTSRPPRALTR